MTGKQKAQAEQEILEGVLARIRSTPREEWLRRIEAYENETGDEPLVAPLSAAYVSNGNGSAASSKNGHKPHG
jgi:hypothetical protein